MEILITIIIAVILTLIILGFLFSHDTEDNLVFSTQENYQKTSPYPKKKPVPQPPENDLEAEVNSPDLITENPELEVNNQQVSWQELSNISKINKLENSMTIEQILSNLVGQKDRCSGEILASGQKIYVCLACELGYHEDSWNYLNQKCDQCKADETQIKSYILPDLVTEIEPIITPKIEFIDRIEYSFRKTIKD